VGQVIIAAARTRRCAWNSTRAALGRYGIGFDEVRAAITGANVNVPKGRHRRPNAVWEIQTNDPTLRR